MAKKSTKKEFILLFRGGTDMADLTPAQQKQVMEGWFTWMGALKQNDHYTGGAPLADDGRVVSGRKGSSVQAFVDSKLAVGGYILMQAKNLAEAVKVSKGCPILERKGSVEVRPIQAM